MQSAFAAVELGIADIDGDGLDEHADADDDNDAIDDTDGRVFLAK